MNLSNNHEFFVKMIEEDNLVSEIHKEISQAEGEIRITLAQLCLNLSNKSDLGKLLSQENVALLAKSCKLLFSTSSLHPDTCAVIRSTTLTTLNNLAVNVPSVRGAILDTDLIHLFETAGFDEKALVLKYCALLNIISNEESCCMKLLENGVQRLLITLQDKFTNDVVNTKQLLADKASGFNNNSNPNKINYESCGKDVTAAILHNMSLKRGTMSSGVLPTLLQIVRNCKDIRVLWAVRAIANYSCHTKARLQLSKEKKIIPLLNGIMRYGCVQADRVQHYCAIAICNILSTIVEKEIMDFLIKEEGSTKRIEDDSSGKKRKNNQTHVTDLVVVTLLRVNSGSTKEFLGKALFNLLCRGDYRARLVELDVLEAIVELGKINNLELLDLCVKCVYNITCEGEKYCKRMDELKLVDMLCMRAAGSREIAGYKATASVRIICAKALANMSFNVQLGTNICNCPSTSDAIHSIYNLESEEAVYCICVILFNVSFLSSVTALASKPLITLQHKDESCIIEILVKILTQKEPLPPASVLCTQLAVGALTNFSLVKVCGTEFHDELTHQAVPVMIKNILLIPAMDIGIKMDALKFLYNVIVHTPASRSISIENDCVVALGKLIKIVKTSDEYSIRLIGRIVKELCAEIQLHKKLMNDGIMAILFYLSKIENPQLKLDLSYAFYSLTTVPDTMKVLKLDGVEVLFWLTFYDSLIYYDPIRKNCGKALRNLTVNKEEAKALVKEDRFGTVLNTLVKSRNEDVLFEAAGILYNLMSIEECKKVMLQRNAIQLIFEIASCNYTPVKHICSACLHMAPGILWK